MSLLPETNVRGNKMIVVQKRLFFILLGVALLIGAHVYAMWQIGEARFWEETGLAILGGGRGPRTSAIFSGLSFSFTILIVLPSLFGWKAFKVAVGLMPFLIGLFGQVVLGYLVGLAIPLSIWMPLGSILLSLGFFGLLSK